MSNKLPLQKPSSLLMCGYFLLAPSFKGNRKKKHLNTTARISSRSFLILLRLCRIQVTCYCILRYLITDITCLTVQYLQDKWLQWVFSKHQPFNVCLELALLQTCLSHIATPNFTATQLWAATALPWAAWNAQAWVISLILRRSQLRCCPLLSTCTLAGAVLC